MEKCVFCQIVSNEIPAYLVYENEKVKAFLDVFPNNPGHTLVIPKKHFKNYEEISEDYLFEVFRTVKKVGQAMKEELGVESYNTAVNNGKLAGQIIPHFHVHVIPRYENDGFKHWPSKAIDADKAKDIAEKIFNNIK